jgi:hypothetical protein
MVQALHLKMIGTEISQIVASPTVVTGRVGTERSAEGIDSAVEEGSQRMLERGASRAVHEADTGRGRMCCATTRAYCR